LPEFWREESSKAVGTQEGGIGVEVGRQGSENTGTVSKVGSE